MDTIKVGRNEYKIEYPLLHKYYNPLYSITYKKIYYGCPRNCKLCQEWKKKGQIWKTFEFFPVHCHLCMEPGNTEDFERVNIFLICLKCNEVLKKRKKSLLRKHHFQ